MSDIEKKILILIIIILIGIIGLKIYGYLRPLPWWAIILSGGSYRTSTSNVNFT